MEVSRFCFEDVVVEDAGELAALELLRLNLFDFDTRLDAIVLSIQPPHKLRQDQATIATPAVTPRSRGGESFPNGDGDGDGDGDVPGSRARLDLGTRERANGGKDVVVLLSHHCRLTGENASRSHRRRRRRPLSLQLSLARELSLSL